MLALRPAELLGSFIAHGPSACLDTCQAWGNLQVLPPGASQSDVYHAAVQPIVKDVLAGYNGTIMAYGQTGAGKTYTLASIDPDAIGMIPRAAADVFSTIAADPAHVFSVSMAYIQIYMELIQVAFSSPSLCCSPWLRVSLAVQGQ